MNESTANPEFTPTPGSPDARSAADDLRSAAAGEPLEPTSLPKTPAAQKAAEIRTYANETAEHFKESAEHLKDTTKEKLSHFRDSAEETAAGFRDSATEHWQETRLKARELHLALEDSIRQSPTKAVLTAAGVGFVLALILKK